MSAKPAATKSAVTGAQHPHKPKARANATPTHDPQTVAAAQAAANAAALASRSAADAAASAAASASASAAVSLPARVPPKPLDLYTNSDADRWALLPISLIILATIIVLWQCAPGTQQWRSVKSSGGGTRRRKRIRALIAFRICCLLPVAVLACCVVLVQSSR